MKTRFFAALTTAFLFLCVDKTRGTDNQLPPASLPVGSPTVFRSWIVTNQIVQVNNRLYYTATNGQAGDWGNFGWKTFSSYPSYQQFTSSNFFRVFNEARTFMDANKQLRQFVLVEYYIPDLDINYAIRVMEINTNIGIVSTITSNSFLSAPSLMELGYVRVPGLQRFVVEVNGLYTNSWPAQPGRPPQTPPLGFNPPQFPTELTTNNYVVLNKWYSMGTNQATFTIVTPALTRRYNRYGERLDVPPTIRVSNDCALVSFVRGATITIECSSNFVNWTTVTNFTDHAAIGAYSMPINKSQPCTFFRAGSR